MWLCENLLNSTGHLLLMADCDTAGNVRSGQSNYGDEVLLTLTVTTDINVCIYHYFKVILVSFHFHNGKINFSRDSSVSIVTGLRAALPKFHSASRLALGVHSAPYPMGNEGSFSESKAAGT
jgi:hypothetical protein